MSGTAVIVIIVLAILVVMGGSIFVLSLNRRDNGNPSDAQEANNGGDLPIAGDQGSSSREN
jgi:hypothetical protein